MRTLRTALEVIIILVGIDLFILMMGIAQVVIEGREVYFAPFWRVQAEILLRLLQ